MDRASDSQADSTPIVEIPHDVVNEQVMIAAALTSDEVRRSVVPKLNPELFVEPAHVAVWAALRGMQQRGLGWSLQTLHQLAGDKVELAYLQQLVGAYPQPPPSIEHHVSALRWDSIRAETVQGPITDLLRALRDPSSAPEKVRALGRAVSASLDANVDRRFMHDPVLVAQQHVDEMTNRAVWPYGIEGLDRYEDGRWRLVPGMAPKKITLLTGVSGSGKSTIAAMIALQQARMRRRVLYGAWEMDRGPTLELMALMSLGWRRTDVSAGGLSAEQLKALQERMEQIGSYVRFFDPPFSSAFSMRYDNDAAIDELYRCVADSAAAVTVLDLLERCLPDGSADAERRALFRVQHIFKATNSHGFIVCQQKLKEIESRADKRPTRGTILGSSAWVDIGDTILGLHLPGQWKMIDRDVMEVDVLKQRFGRWPLAVEFDYDADRCALTDGRSIEYAQPGSERTPSKSAMENFLKDGR